MLILSRRLNEKILFPDLGIEIQVVSIKGKSTRIAVEAPRSIRIVREELEDHNAYDLCDTNSEREEFERHSDFGPSGLEHEPEIEKIQQQIDTVNLALYLAQNQLQAERTEYAEESLATAIETMQQLNALFRDHPEWKDHLPVSRYVKESSSTYSVGNQKAWLVTADPDQAVIEDLRRDIPSQFTDSKLNVQIISPQDALQQFASNPPDVLCVVSEGDQDSIPVQLPLSSRLNWSGYRFINQQRLATWHVQT